MVETMETLRRISLRLTRRRRGDDGDESRRGALQGVQRGAQGGLTNAPSANRGADVDGARGRQDRSMHARDADQVESLLKACDEVLAYHERAGSGDGTAASEVRAKRDELRECLERDRGF
jgi:hypothetical protein